MFQDIDIDEDFEDDEDFDIGCKYTDFVYK